MPFNVEMPDGTIIEDVPDGTPKEVIREKWVKMLGNYSSTEGMGSFEKFAAGAGKAVYDLGRGIGQMLPKGPMGMAGPQVTRQDIADSRALDAPLMDTTAGTAGNLAGNVAMIAPTVVIPGANTVTGAGVIGGVSGLLQPSTSTKETLTNTAVGTVLGAGGQKGGEILGNKVGQAITTRATNAATRQSENAVRDATVAEARRVGYVMPPSTINQTSRAANVADSFAGRAAGEQTASVRNQKITNQLIREDLGLSGRGQITQQELDGVRQQAGNVYAAVSNSGRIVTDQQYLNELAQLANVTGDVAQEFPGASAPAAQEIKDLADTLLQSDFSSEAAVKYVRMLREEAKANFKAVNAGGGDATKLALAHAQREAAGTLEDMVLRNLRATGRGSLADSFDKARVTIAKAHDAEAALNVATGNIDATKLGALLRRGKPLGGNFETVAKFASAFPKVAGEVKNGPGVSAATAMLSSAAGIGGATFGNPAAGVAMASLPFARSAARGLVYSKAGQAMAMPSYGPKNTLLELIQRTAPLSSPVAVGIGNAE